MRQELARVPNQPDLLLSAIDPLDPAGWPSEGDGRAPAAFPAAGAVGGAAVRGPGSAKRTASKLERSIENRIEFLNLPMPEREHRFHPTRKWRFDFAWPARRLAVEVQGGIWTGGKHGRGAGIEKDAEKFNEAQLLGWVVIIVSPGHIRTGQAMRWIEKALGVADLPQHQQQALCD